MHDVGEAERGEVSEPVMYITWEGSPQVSTMRRSKTLNYLNVSLSLLISITGPRCRTRINLTMACMLNIFLLLVDIQVNSDRSCDNAGSLRQV